MAVPREAQTPQGIASPIAGIHGKEQPPEVPKQRVTDHVRYPRALRQRCDVVANPAERIHQVRDADVGRALIFFAKAREVEVPDEVQPVVHRDDDHIAPAGEVCAVVDLLDRRGPRGEAAAVQPDHHRALPAIVDAGRPDVEVLAIVVLPETSRRVVPAAAHPARPYLRGDRAIVEGQPYALPRRDLPRRDEPLLRLRVGDSVVGVDAVSHVPLHLARFGTHHRDAGPGRRRAGRSRPGRNALHQPRRQGQHRKNLSHIRAPLAFLDETPAPQFDDLRKR